MEKLSNNRLKELLKNNQKKFRSKTDYVLVEGKRLINQLHINNIKILELFCLESEITHYKYISPDKLTICNETQFNRLSDSKTSQNLIAKVKKPIRELKDKRFLLYLDNLSEPGNLGTIFRTASALGISGIVLSPGCCDVFNPKVIRSSLGAIFTIPFDIMDYEWVKSAQSHIICTELNGANSIYEMEPVTYPIILVIGSEAHGISKNLLAIADQKIFIPMSNAMESLNASVAAAICMFHLINS